MKFSTKKRVIVGMSGGVDSAVAALLLKQQDYDVHGVFMRNWQTDKDDPNCTAEQDLTDARAVCDQINIPLQTVDFSAEYWDKVFQYFLNEYAAGRTPNPDVLCNKEIKFRVFLDYALAQKADYIATGHYARCSQRNQQYFLLMAADKSKDQSYFLYTLTQEQLSYSLFPLGELLKTEVRKIAQQAGFINYAKKDSTGICFIGERKFNRFLQEYLLAKPGNIETDSGEIIGKHNGLMFYTLGQRQGLGIGGRKNKLEAAWYVLAKDINRNTLIVGQQHDHPRLFATTLTCEQVHWINPTNSNEKINCTAKIRYRQSNQACTVYKINDTQYRVDFAKPQRAITPGQSVVFYQDELCLGGGIITTRWGLSGGESRFSP